MFRKYPLSCPLTAIFVSIALIYSGSLYADQLALPTGDLIAPKVEHEPDKNPITQGNKHTVVVKVTDNVGVKTVLLFYRTTGMPNYKRIVMSKGDEDLFQVILPEAAIEAPGMEYYIRADDLAGNSLLHGHSFSPVTLKVAVKVTADEGGKTLASEDQLGDEISVATTVGLAGTQTKKSGEQTIWKNKWLWVGLGVLVVGAAASGGDGNDGPSGKPSTTTDITVTAPAP